MKINEEIKRKINKILYENNISLNKLANLSCVTQSTIESIVTGDSKNPKLLTIVRICDGLNITLSEFFDDDIFNDIDVEN